MDIINSIVVAEPFTTGHQETLLQMLQRHHTRRRETPSESKYLLQILMVNGLDTAPLIKFYPPTAWGSSRNDKSMAVTIFGMARSPPCAHSDAITQRQRMVRFHQCVRFGAHVPRCFRLLPRVEFHRSTSTIRCYRFSPLAKLLPLDFAKPLIRNQSSAWEFLVEFLSTQFCLARATALLPGRAGATTMRTSM